MPAPQGVVRVHRHDRTVTFQVEGWTTMNQSLSFRRTAEQHLAGGAADLRIDLRRCTFMDSTFIGTLLYLQRAVARRKESRFVLVCPSSPCDQLFQKMGLDGVFAVEAAEELPAGDWTELSRTAEDVKAFQCNVVQAHQELASLPGRAGEPFRAVMRCLEKESPTDQIK
jgi:anti-anti-sigma factor